jgi:hypothetical protein
MLASLALLLPAAAHAHDLSKAISGSCRITNTSGSVKMDVDVTNTSGETLKTVRAGQTYASGSGNASIVFQTFPRAVRELLPGKTTTLSWRGRVYGDGYLDRSLEVLAQASGGTANSGIINCNRIAVGNPGPVQPPTPTRRPATATARPGTATPRPTATPTRGVRATPTRTRIPTATQRPTRTPIPQRATRTPLGGGRSTPTRGTTPGTGHEPTPTATRHSSHPNYNPNGLRASCSLRRTIDLVTVTLVVQNNTGGDIRGMAGGQLSLDPEGGALFFDRTGPNPTTYSLVRNGFSVSFQWSGRLTPNGTMGFSAMAGGIGPDNRPVNIQLTDCGSTTADGGDFNPSGFVASCGIAQDGRVTVNVANHSGATLSNVTPILKATNSTGGARVTNLTGPVPGSTRRLPDGQNASYAWRSRFSGYGQIAMQFEVTGLRPNEQRASSGLVNCDIRLQGGGGNLPDIGVDSEALRQSVRITNENFGRGHCAFVEGCLGGTGARRLLRFSTMTPNYGPGDLFVGDPTNNPDFVFSECHAHYHFSDYADYRLLDMQGNLVARGHKQAFCLVDLERVPGVNGSNSPKFPDCGFQGISAGWADVYHSGLDCQWVDITGVPEGRYILEVSVNPARVIEEGNFTNNSARTEVFIPRQ